MTNVAIKQDTVSVMAIDEDHLSRQTFGDATLAREVLTLFIDQCAADGPRLSHLAPCERSALAHRLKGAARGIGAFRLAATLETIERADSFGGAARALAAFTVAHREAETAARSLIART